jgi:hypothetical protein
MTSLTTESAAILLARLEESMSLVDINVAMVPRSVDIAVTSMASPSHVSSRMVDPLLAAHGWQHKN